MSRRKARRAGPVVLSRAPHIPAGRRVAPRAEILQPEALDAPLPGQLLVLLSRLHRAEPAASPEKADPAA